MQPRCTPVRGEVTLGLEICAKAPGWEGGGGNEVRSSFGAGGEAAETPRTVSWNRLDVAGTESTAFKDEEPSPSGNPNQRPKDDQGSSDNAGDAEPSDIDSGPPTGARKFDIRTWVLVTACEPLEAFVFDESYLRVCPHAFTLDESKFSDPHVHLTNLSARRPIDRFSRACDDRWKGRQQQRRGEKRPASASASCRMDHEGGRARECKAGEEQDAGEARSEVFVASQAELFQALGEMYEEDGVRGTRGEGEGEEHMRARGERLWRSKVSPSIEGIVRSTLLAAQPHMRPRARSFQLFGFDIILDHQLHPCESRVDGIGIFGVGVHATL